MATGSGAFDPRLARLRFFAPVRMPGGLEASALIADDPAERAAAAGSFAALLSALRGALPGFAWSGPQGIAVEHQSMLAFEFGRAPSQRPQFALAFEKPIDAAVCSAIRSRTGIAVASASVRCAIQDFGIALAEYDLRIDPAEPLPRPYNEAADAAFDILRELDLATILAGCDAIAEQAGRLGLAIPPLYSIAGGGSPEPESSALYWFHAFSQFTLDCAPDRVRVWRGELRANGCAERLGHAIDEVMRLRVGTHVALHGRNFDADVLIGWGNSYSVTCGCDTAEAIGEAVPLSLAFGTAQAFSALLYSLNQTSVRLLSRFVHPATQVPAEQIHTLSEATATIEGRIRSVTALLRELRYCLAAPEQRLWDAATTEWGDDKLLLDVRGNIAALREVLAQHERELNDRRNERLSFALLLVTMFSASAVVFSMLPNLLLSRDPSRTELVLQTAVVLLLLGFSIVLARATRRRRRERRRARESAAGHRVGTGSGPE